MDVPFAQGCWHPEQRDGQRMLSRARTQVRPRAPALPHPRPPKGKPAAGDAKKAAKGKPAKK